MKKLNFPKRPVVIVLYFLQVSMYIYTQLQFSTCSEVIMIWNLKSSIRKYASASAHDRVNILNIHNEEIGAKK